MALELTRDMLMFDQVVGEGKSETLVDRDIIVPDIKPDIAKILSVEAEVNITNQFVEQDRIAVEGNVDFAVLYTAEGENQLINSMNQSVDFSNYIDIPGAVQKMIPDVNCGIEHVDYDKLNGRKLNVQCVINMTGKVKDNLPVEVVKDCLGVPDIQLLKDTIVIDDAAGENSAQTVVKNIIEIPSSLPSLSEIVKYKAMLHKKDVKVEEGRVTVNGSIFVTALFISKEEKPDLYSINDDSIFTYTLDMPGVMPDMNCLADFSIDEMYFEPKENDEGENRQIDVEVVVGLKVKVMTKKELTVIIDAYAPSAKIECEKENVTVDSYFGGNNSQTILKESLTLPDDCPDVDKLYDIVCSPAVTDYKVVDDKVVIEGVAKCDVIYLVKGEERLINSFTDEIPFRTSISVPGCKIDMKPFVKAEIEQVDFSLVNMREIEVKISLGCSAHVYKKLSQDFIVKMEDQEKDEPLHKSSITIYMVQSKDTLWKIAKRYFTTVENIVRVNEIEDPDKLIPGMKLVIPQKM